MKPFNNMSIEEKLKYCDLSREQYQELFEEVLNLQDELEKEIERLNKREERLEEQIHFASEIIDGVKSACRNNSVAKELKKEISNVIENSYFEC